MKSLKFRLLLILLLLVMNCEGPEGPMGPQGPQGPQGEKGDPRTPAETQGYYLTALYGNGQTKEVSLESETFQFDLLVTNIHGVPIDRCRIDWEVIEGGYIWYNSVKYETLLTHTNSAGKIQVDVRPDKYGLVKVRATVFATGDSIDFIATAEER